MDLIFGFTSEKKSEKFEKFPLKNNVKQHNQRQQVMSYL